eukprot:CAMPEP_0174259648 /NCGR_PEP_ID=MMETSP0439-20130205/8456_1 /TAXON_ID=0 /ORGANISM="Stereomyxa ramosa, Strain Chinc5" /LENGTH=372 /DNA_ID=CAMNT_0015343623 /DNA_START=56 /DNA_END=1174 /DNA_ORIENTATION=+
MLKTRKAKLLYASSCGVSFLVCVAVLGYVVYKERRHRLYEEDKVYYCTANFSYSGLDDIPSDHNYSLHFPPLFSTIAFVGDLGDGSETVELLNMVYSDKATMLVPGDLDYLQDPERFEEILDQAQIDDSDGNPFFAALGNHDVLWNQRVEHYLVELVKAEGVAADGCSGIPAMKACCTYRGVVHVQLSAVSYSCFTIKKQAAYVRQQLGVKYRNYPWKFCMWHHPLGSLQVGHHTEEMPEMYDLYQACLDVGAVIINGHSHTYSRTYALSNFKNKTLGKYGNKTHVEIIPGEQTMVIVNGLGGHDQEPAANNIHKPYMATYLGEGDTNFGALFCEFTGPTVASCYFKDLDQKIRDQFFIHIPDPLSVKNFHS